MSLAKIVRVGHVIGQNSVGRACHWSEEKWKQSLQDILLQRKLSEGDGLTLGAQVERSRDKVWRESEEDCAKHSYL